MFAYPYQVVKMEIVLKLWSAIAEMVGREDFVKFLSAGTVKMENAQDQKNAFASLAGKVMRVIHV